MHLIVAVEGYREAVERWIKDVEGLDVSTKNTSWKPIVREIKLLDVTVPEERLQDFLKKIGDGAADLGLKGELEQPEPAVSSEQLAKIKGLFSSVLGLDIVPRYGHPGEINHDRLYFVILGSLPQAYGGKQGHEFL
jgi:hypothetical protein